MKILNFFLATIIILLIAFVLIVNLLQKTPRPQMPERSDGEQASAEINGHTFSLYLAKTASEQEVGLAKYKSIAQNQGMLFLFERSDYYSFWMKNMHFPIDIIFISNNKVVDVSNDVPVSPNNNLPVYTTKIKANKVLEINAGLAKKYGIKVGSEVKIKL
jgi:uncharacterized membrane protein (UPF0127 family)